MTSISVAKNRGATLRVGPELEIPSVLHLAAFAPGVTCSCQWLWLLRPLLGRFGVIQRVFQSLIIMQATLSFIHGKF
jgi:hypothetical protein